MRQIGRGWVLVGVLMAVVVTQPTYSQVALTAVADTVYTASGAAAQGTVLVSWSAFTTAAGNAVAAGQTSAILGANGALSLSLAPNEGATPTGSYYTAVLHLSDGTTSRQYWVVPAGGGPVKLASVENQLLPTSVAMQTVSKAYVDHAIAAAVVTGAASSVTTGSAYVQKSGDTMTGALLLPGDPVSAQQAADKHYVDVNIAALGGGSATKVSTLPSATQTVVQPAGTQLEVNALNGVLDATGWLTGNGSNGFSNALASSNCTSGCEVVASEGYPGGEGAPAAGLPSGTRIVDERGGSDIEIFENPLPAGGASLISKSVTQITTMSAQQAYATRPSTGENSTVMTLVQNAPTGGSNQFPADAEFPPYNKNNYGVLQMFGNYNTQGQHVQAGNVVNCYSVGDCLAGGQFITTSGGYRDEADEGTHPFDLQIMEDSRVFQGTCGSGCSLGATRLTVNPTAGGGTQGDGRFLIDKSPSKVITTGSISGDGGDYLPIVNFTGTHFPISTQLMTAAKATSQAANLAPGTVTLPIVTTGLSSGYAMSTAALPSTTGVACVTDQGRFPNFETAAYSVVDASHVTLTLNKVHLSGAVLSVGGLCGYGLEEIADTQGQIRQVFPVSGSPSSTQVYYASALTYVVGANGGTSTGGFLSTSNAIVAATRNGNIVTLTFGQAIPNVNGLSMTVSGVADASYNGTFQVTTIGSSSLTYTASGPNGSSSGGTASFANGGFALYPMAEVLSVYNPASASVDGTFTLAPNTVAWAAGDLVEEPHYHQQLVYADVEYITQFLPRPTQYISAGKFYAGQLGPGARGWEIHNGVPASDYLSGGGTHQVPDSAYLAAGPWRNSIEVDAGTEAVLRIHCNLHSCSRWDSGYALFAMDRNGGVEDFLSYQPQSDTATWQLGGTQYSFSPGAFSASTINATTINMNGVGLSSAAAGQAAIASSVAPLGATLTATNSFSGTALPIAAYCPNVSPGNPCLFPIGSSFAPNSVGILAWQPAGFFQMQTFNNASPIQIGGSAINTTAPLMVNNGAGVNQLGNTCAVNISLCVNPSATMTVDVNGNVAAPAYHETLRTPASSSTVCSAGDFADDANFHYVCVAANSWKRVALSSF